MSDDYSPTKTKIQVFVSLGIPLVLVITLYVGIQIYHAGPGYRKLNSHPYLGQCFKVTEQKRLAYEPHKYQSKVLNDALDIKGIDRNLWYYDSIRGQSKFVLEVGDMLAVDAVVKLDVIDPENHSKYIFMRRLASGEGVDFIFVENDACGQDGYYCLDRHPKMVPAPCPSTRNER